MEGECGSVLAKRAPRRAREDRVAIEHQDALGRRVAREHAPLSVDEDDPFAEHRNDGAVPLLVLLKRALELFALRDVDDGADETSQLPPLVVERRLVEDDVASQAVRVRDGALVDLNATRRQQLVVRALVCLSEVGRSEIEIAHADDLVAREPEVRLERLVAAAIDTARILEIDGRRDRVEDHLERVHGAGSFVTRALALLGLADRRNLTYDIALSPQLPLISDAERGRMSFLRTRSLRRSPRPRVG